MLSDDEKLRRLEKALAYGGDTHDVADVVGMIERREAQWWSNDDGFIVTEIHAFPKLKALSYWLIGGQLKACLDMETMINAWGRREGCTVAISCGRKGWARAANTGWMPRPHMFPVWKPLTPSPEGEVNHG